MADFFQELFGTDRFLPHGGCMAWMPELLWLHGGSDALIALSYLAISAGLIFIAGRRRDRDFRDILIVFGGLSFFCGVTHALEVWTLWRPVYGLEGTAKLATALVSAAAAVALWPLIPKALAWPSPAMLRRSNLELEREIGEHRNAETELRKHREHLETLIEERTAALKRINQQLLQENIDRRQAQRELALARDLAEHASRAKSQFLANMSHELRTPLNAIIGFSEVLEDQTFGPLNDRQRRYVSNILTSGRDLLQLINDVLDLSKIEAGRMELEPVPFNPADALGDVEKVVRALAAKKRISLTLEPDPALPTVFADPSKFKQIMYNLLSNAVKFTPDGGSVRVRASQVYVDADGEPPGAPVGDCLEVSVEDTGIGIAPEDQERVFGEFEQLDSSFQRMHEGSGLGLALTRKLVELHGGRIWVESAGKDQGSTFRFRLPLVPAPEIPAGPRDGVSAVSGDNHQTEPSAASDEPIVLVVEDEPNARELLTHYLCSAGYRVAEARDGEEALRMARELRPAAITLDVLLPKRDGWEVLRELKSAPETSDIPVIIVSITKDTRLGFALGAIECFVKPVSRDRLVEAVGRVGAAHDKKDLTVLVVDDEPESLEVISSILEGAGHRVLTAQGGREGLERAVRHLPDALVLDLVMPDFSGLDVIQRLREHPEARKIPVLVFTGRDLSAEEREELRCAIQAVVPKSAREELIQILSGLRKRQRA